MMMKNKLRSFPLLCAGIAASIGIGLPATARAVDLYSQADLGVTQFIGAGKDAAELGPAFGGRLGLGIFPWLTVGAHASGSTHRSSIDGPTEGEYFQIYNLGADLRARLSAGKIGFYVEGGAGWAWISTNILDSVGITQPEQHNGGYLAAGGGLEYATENPRYAFGLGGDFTKYLQFGDLQSLSVNVYLRYTK